MTFYHIYKIVVKDKIFIGGTYDYTQLKGKFFKSNYFQNIRLYNNVYEYINKNNISNNDIHFHLIYRKEFEKRCISEHRLILDEFIEMYNSIENGLNMSKIDNFTKKVKFKKIKKDTYNMSKSDRSRKYYEKHRNEILLRNREKKYCNICNCNIVHSQLTRHRKTQKHILNLTINDLKKGQVSLV